MKGFKSHLGVVLSLFTLLFSIQFNFFINDAIKKYEQTMVDNYSIVVVSKNALELKDIANEVKEVSTIEEISGDEMILSLKDKISKDSLEQLQKKLPKFYNIKLKFFPNIDEIKTISKNLEKVEGVAKVEIFAKAHDSIYKIMLLLKNIVYIFSILIAVLSFMLVIKQMKIWLFEHSQRVEVMTLFGASFCWKSADLYKMAILDSIIATCMVLLVYVFLAELEYFRNIINIIEFSYTNVVLLDYFVYLLSVALVLSIFSATLVMLDLERKNKI
ncbi:cell division protein FtsX [Campylobacter blaseri]|uniref:Cell division protein FtsX n=1 Tax=Campylobacter blaseri TaxID=2042961 RepID=A0A2P8R030_9BACT|nr:cell division protein FtsX [Campylobacter blaseri]PSM51850.1 cell division protein FtsX [Campylobacter blaseri]PSM53641.1 cell division protein FtsX [Campylobacter blaseri]QKF86456.1 cell division protein FtsX [Campylobacter blaseri]